MSHRGRKRVVDESESLGGGEDEELTLDKIFTDPTFDPNTLTKLSLRSALSNLGGLAYEDLPPPNAKKQVYLDFFHQNIIAKKNRLWRKNKAIIPDGKGIVVVNQDGSYETTNGTPLKGTPGKTPKATSRSRSPSFFSDENPFQSPPSKKERKKSKSRSTKSPRRRSPTRSREFSPPRDTSPLKRQKAAFPVEDEGDDQIGLNSPTYLRKKVAFALPEKLSYQALSHSNVVTKEPIPKTDRLANGSKDILASPSGISTWKQVQLILLWAGSGLFFLIIWTQTFLDPFIVFISALTLGGFFIWWRSYQKSLQFKRALALQLEELVIDKLVEQELLAQEDPEKYATSIPVLQLRDALFHSSHCRRDDGRRTMMAAEKGNSEGLGNSIENISQMSEKDKKWIWKIVVARLQRNSNIRESMMTWKGDTHIVWEWIGPAVLSPKKK